MSLAATTSNAGQTGTAPALTLNAETHTYRLGDRVLPSVTQILSAVGIGDFSAPWFTEAVRDRGTHVHQAIALDVEGDLDEDALAPALWPYIDGWRRFLAESQVTVEHVERAVCDPDLGYAGTLDAIVVWPAAGGRATRRTLLDLKHGLYPAVGPQTAAYARCARAVCYATPVLLDRAALELTGDGRYQLHPLRDTIDEQVFLAALRIWHFKAAHGG